MDMVVEPMYLAKYLGTITSLESYLGRAGRNQIRILTAKWQRKTKHHGLANISLLSAAKLMSNRKKMKLTLLSTAKHVPQRATLTHIDFEKSMHIGVVTNPTGPMIHGVFMVYHSFNVGCPSLEITSQQLIAAVNLGRSAFEGLLTGFMKLSPKHTEPMKKNLEITTKRLDNVPTLWPYLLHSPSHIGLVLPQS